MPTILNITLQTEPDVIVKPSGFVETDDDDEQVNDKGTTAKRQHFELKVPPNTSVVGWRQFFRGSD